MNRPQKGSDEELFDFLTNQDFKANLKSDFAELQAAVKGGLWKAAHVLAGSIIEAVLLDYLIAAKHEGKPKEELLKWDLGKAIPAGLKEGILTDVTAQMAVVVKNYRNLIHPGRILRLEEEVNPEGATVALSLVKMVARDIAKKKAKVYGYTAEQLVNKLEQDPHCVILPHLLAEMNETERDRLLLEVLPGRNFKWDQNPHDEDGNVVFTVRLAAILETCFRLVYKFASDDLKKAAIKQYVRILKEQTTLYRQCYEMRFFRCSEIVGVADASDAQLIKYHLFGLLERGYDTRVLTMAAGVGRLLTLEDVESGCAKAIWRPGMTNDDADHADCVEWLRQEFYGMPQSVQDKLLAEMESQEKHWRMTGQQATADRMKNLRDARFPF